MAAAADAEVADKSLSLPTTPRLGSATVDVLSYLGLDPFAANENYGSDIIGL